MSRTPPQLALHIMSNDDLDKSIICAAVQLLTEELEEEKEESFLEEERAIWMRVLGRPDAALIYCTDPSAPEDTKPVAFSTLVSPFWNLKLDQRSLYLVHLLEHSSAKHKDALKLLLDEVKNHAANLRREEIFYCTNRLNAKSWYDSLLSRGWELVRDREDDEPWPHEKKDGDVLMKLKISGISHW